MTTQTRYPGAIRLAVPLELDPRAVSGLDRFARIVDLTGDTMGTIWRVRVAAPMAFDVAALQAVIVSRLDAIVAEMSHWLPTSLLCRFNRSKAGAWTPLPADFATVIAAGLEIARRSGGTFDPTIGRLIDLWGYGATRRAEAPDDRDIDRTLRESGWQKLAYAPQTRRIRQPGGLSLDLSGIAKGFAADVLADLIAGAGIGHCLVEIGGECVGRGMRPDGDPWWVDLETPPELSFAPLRVALHQMAVATSGNYVRGAHTIDPATGIPVQNGVGAVSVLHRSAMIADAWASAFTVMGADRMAVVAEREKLAVRVVSQNGERGAEWISPALAQMM